MLEDKKVKLERNILNLWNKVTKQEIQKYISKHDKIFSKAFNRRPVFLDEFLEISEKRWGNDENHRRRAFFSVVELIKKAEKNNITNTENGIVTSYELKWITPDGKIVGAHIKEFLEDKNRKLKLISIFWKE